MPTCPKCHKLCKTAQGPNGHMRFRHQMTAPKQHLPVYARDRLERAEDENAKLREQVARLQRQRQDQETFYEKRMAEQKAEQERAQERKIAEQQRAAAFKQREEEIRLERARAQEGTIAGLRKEMEDLKKIIEQSNSQKEDAHELGKRVPETEGQGVNTGELGQVISELEKARQDLRRERHRAKGSSPFPPAPHPLRPLSSLRKFRGWLFPREDEGQG